MDLFSCKANNNGYCELWLRECVGGDNCKQGNCAYCVKSSISPKIESECNNCDRFWFKKENYRE